MVAKFGGALFLIFLGVRGWMTAATPLKLNSAVGSIYGRALVIATINAKSVAGYLAAFSLFVQPDVPVWGQMVVLMPTALCLTALSYTGYTALGVAFGKLAMAKVFNVMIRRGLAICFVVYGALLGAASVQSGL
jgi:homoserine/homoserine lactone efflux protein